MKIAPVAEIKAKFSEYLKECQNGVVIVTKNGKPKAALISINSDEELERIIIYKSKMLQDYLSNAEKRIKSNKGIKHNEFWNNIEA